jgi:hypothetical protein
MQSWRKCNFRSIHMILHQTFHTRSVSCTTNILTTIFIDTSISLCFNRFLHDSAGSVSVWGLSDTVRVWTCRAGQQWKWTYSMNEFSVVFKHIQVHFHQGQWKIYWIRIGTFIFAWFTGQKLLKKTFIHHPLVLCIEFSILLLSSFY